MLDMLRSPKVWMGPLVLAIVACGEPAAEPLTFRYHLEASPFSLDPARVNDSYSLGVIDRLFDSLTRLDPVRGVPEPEMAASYSMSEDGRVYEFHIRPDARFHHGRPVTAADFKYSWQRLLDPAAPSQRAWHLERIAGAEEFQSGRAESISGVEVVAPEILRVHLKEPHDFFLHYLASPSLAAVPQEEVERMGDSFGQHPVGSGPYRFESWVPDLRLELTAFDSHGRHSPQVVRLIFEIVPEEHKALELYSEGRLDLVTRLPGGAFRRMQTRYPGEVYMLPTMNWAGFCFRVDRPPFDDSRVRRALALAVDRERMACALGDDEKIAGFGFLPQGVAGHDPSNTGGGQDLARAEALLAEAGYPEGAGFPKLMLATRSATHTQKSTRALLASWAQLGIRSEYRVMDFASLIRDAKLGRWDSFYRAWISEIPDPDLFLRPIFHSRGRANYSAYVNPEVDRLLDAARSELDSALRLELYRRAEAIIIADAPCISLYQDFEVVILASRWRDLPLGRKLPSFEIERARLVKESM